MKMISGCNGKRKMTPAPTKKSKRQKNYLLPGTTCLWTWSPSYSFHDHLFWGQAKDVDGYYRYQRCRAGNSCQARLPSFEWSAQWGGNIVRGWRSFLLDWIRLNDSCESKCNFSTSWWRKRGESAHVKEFWGQCYRSRAFYSFELLAVRQTSRT